jgi:protein involved in polysaccharide export with SLBB domain
MKATFLAAAFFFVLVTASSAQSDLGTTRPPRGESRPTGIARDAGGVLRAGTLSAGDEVFVRILEDREPGFRTVISDKGEVEVNGLGRVYVAGKTLSEAQEAIAIYLKEHYYRHATVELGIVRKPPICLRPFKLVVTGKVERPGPQYFTTSSPLKLSEAVVIARSALNSDLRKVRLIRGPSTTDHNVEAIIKEGRKDMDVQLQDGDQVFVPEQGSGSASP